MVVLSALHRLRMRWTRAFSFSILSLLPILHYVLTIPHILHLLLPLIESIGLLIYILVVEQVTVYLLEFAISSCHYYGRVENEDSCVSC